VIDTDRGLACRLRSDSVAGSWAVASEIVASVAEQRVEQQWGGLEAQSVDGVPFIGPAPGLDGLFLAVGFSGHGFQLSPAVGRAVADLVGGARVPELEPVSTRRIRHFDAAVVDAFKRAPLAEHGATLSG
jgi:sarcosine oxidase subunit beta